MDVSAKAIGQKVQELRSRMGLTTTSLAKKVRLSQAQVSRLENGLQGFRSATLHKFAKVLGVPPIYFFVEGQAATEQVVADLDARGLKVTSGLRKALENAAFLRFMEKCAKKFNQSKKSLVALDKVVKSV